MKRISFSDWQAHEIYEWLRFYWAKERKHGLDKFGCCAGCTIIGERLEKFVGKKVVREVEKLLRKDVL